MKSKALSNACRAVQEQLVDFSDGQLAPNQQRHIAEHLAACGKCKAELRLLTRSLEVTLAAWQASEPSVVELASKTPGVEHVRPRRRMLSVAGVLAASLFVGVAWTSWRVGQPSSEKPVDLATIQSANSPQVWSSDAINDFISHRARSARLTEAARVLASQPELEDYRLNAEHYLKGMSADISRKQ